MMKRLSSALLVALLSSLPAFTQTPGTLKWALSTGHYVQSSPAMGLDGTIYVGSRDGNLYAIDPAGAQKWSFTTGNGIQSSPAVGTDGTIYVGSRDNKLYAINPDGTQKWAFTTGMWVDSSPAIGPDGTIYAGSGDGKLYAINPDGTKKWAFVADVALYASPTVGPDGTIYQSSWGNKLWAVDPDGVLKWALTVGVFINSSFSFGNDGTLYLGSHEGKLYAINEDGSFKWISQFAGSGTSSPAIGADGTIYTGSIDFNLYAIDPAGVIKWAFPTGKIIETSPAIGSDGTIYFGCDDQNVYAVDQNGMKKWAFLTGGQVQSSPAIGPDGTIYVGSKDNKLYGIHGSGQGLTASSWPRFHGNNQNTGLFLTLYISDETLFSFFTSGENKIKPFNIINPFNKDLILENAIFTDRAFSMTSTLPVAISAGSSVALDAVIQTDSSRLYQSRVQFSYSIDGSASASFGRVSAGLMQEEISERALIFRRALDAYTTAKARDAKSIAAANNLGVLFRTLGEPVIAEAKFMDALRDALNARYGYAGLMMNMGVVKSDQDSSQSAYDFYSKALPEQVSLDDGSALNPQVIYNLAWEDYATGDLSDAAAMLDILIDESYGPDFLKAKAYVLRGALNWRNTQKTAAITDFQQAMNLDPDGPIGAMGRENILQIETGVSAQPEIFPEEFSFSPNYPNPFNLDTVIRFALPRKSFVRIQVINMRGENVRRLVQEAMEAGWGEVTWDGRNDYGELVGSGLYFLRFEADDFARTIKATLIR